MFKLGLVFLGALVSAQTGNLTAYCTALEAQCYGTHQINATQCMSAFANFPNGTITDADVNTLGCRQKFLVDNTTCRFAGVTAGGRCGSVLPAVCNVATTICAGSSFIAYATVDACLKGLNGTHSYQWGSKQGALSSGEDSLECRAYHAIASTQLGTDHCAHFNQTTSPCSTAISTNAAVYCDTLMYNCQGPNNTQYANLAQCVKVTAGFPTEATPDARSSNGGNNLGCRQYHVQAARDFPDTHCQHAGPSGGEACGSPREAWASILAAAPCNDGHVKDFLANVSTTLVETLIPKGFGATSPYHIGRDTSKNTQACRIYHLGVASNTAGHCTHGAVSGGDNCGKFVPNLCDFVGQVCGFGAEKWQFATSALCNSSLTAVNAAGVIGPSIDNTYECRFYHAGVAATYLAGGKNAGAADKTTQMQAHCSHVLNPAAGGGCNGGATTAPSPAGKANAGVQVSLSAAAALIVAAFVIF